MKVSFTPYCRRESKMKLQGRIQRQFIHVIGTLCIVRVKENSEKIVLIHLMSDKDKMINLPKNKQQEKKVKS
jgi:hypothetical protein